MTVLVAVAAVLLAWLLLACLIAWALGAVIERSDAAFEAARDTLAHEADAAWEKTSHPPTFKKDP